MTFASAARTTRTLLGGPLIWAASEGSTIEIARLIERGAPLGFADQSGVTPLQAAVRHGHEEAVRLLLDRGAPANTVDAEGRSPFDEAARGGHLEIAKGLLAHGARRGRQLTWRTK